MTGESVPLVLVPRFTGLVGEQDFATVPIDVTAYAKAVVTLWRGPVLGTVASFTAFFEVSHDNVTWFKIPVGTGESGFDPSEAGDLGALVITLPFDRRWFRIRIELRGDDGPAVTCWCSGNLELRIVEPRHLDLRFNPVV
jgi:hypothetical protein